MADEISTTSKITASKGGIQVAQLATTDYSTQATAEASFHFVHMSKSYGTTETALDVGSVNTAASYWVKLRNLNATNFVTVYVKATAVPLYMVIGKMRAGEMWGPCLMPAIAGGLGGIYLDADAAACIVEVVAFDN